MENDQIMYFLNNSLKTRRLLHVFGVVSFQQKIKIKKHILKDVFVCVCVIGQISDELYQNSFGKKGEANEMLVVLVVVMDVGVEG